jgi:hypothetical protein
MVKGKGKVKVPRPSGRIPRATGQPAERSSREQRISLSQVGGILLSSPMVTPNPQTIAMDSSSAFGARPDFIQNT